MSDGGIVADSASRGSSGTGAGAAARSDDMTREPGRLEFTLLLSMLMGLVALSIDLMLPALGDIALDLHASEGNARQAVIWCLFLGLGVGQLVFGPLSDALGRRPAIFAGTALFVLGSLLAATADTFGALLAARLLQGFGAAGPRLVSVAMVRDRLSGPEMASLLSTVATVFILAPVLAPSIGELALALTTWRGLFVALAASALAGAAWLAVRQPETLLSRRPLAVAPVVHAFAEVLRSRRALSVTIAAACAYGSLMGYVYSSQQLFQDGFGAGERYALLFGGSAAFIAAGTWTNARIVVRFGTDRVCRVALGAQLAWAGAWTLWLLGGHPPSLVGWLVFSCPALFAGGLTYGNFNAMALEPLGHVAGTAAAVVASLQTLLGAAVAGSIGAAWNGTVLPVVVGYALCAAIALGFLRRSVAA